MRVGLTGGIASGKSAVADLLTRFGAFVIDSDVLAREVVAPGTPGWEAVRRRFGDEVMSPAGGELDRAALGAIVFADAAARGDLEAIVHPAVRRRAREIEAEAGGGIVVHVIPLLVETGQADTFDHVVVVDVPEAVQRQRLMARSGLTADEADARIAAQASRRERLAVAGHVLDNSGTPAELEDQVRTLWDALRRFEGLPGAG
ncbi:dephospho-CoA kinase [Propionicicella superfundia]|uniref:dephospho-CoA kinase n=1 Tax=Propionicicella superfundia TaxID=348582 RepID=UPI000410E8B7|nr:dephospho-CoA kinase [Propionicicella superfundia]